MNRNIIYIAVVSCIMTAACSKAIPDGFCVDNAGQYATVYLGAAFHGNLEKILVPE
jgi:ferredoxin